jgi:threonine dehydratase
MRKTTRTDLTRGVYRRAPSSQVWPPPPVPTAGDIREAVEVVSGILPPTPMVHSPQLSRVFDRDIHLKLETLGPVRSFKHRGALMSVRKIARVSPGTTIVTASTGNHGQGIAYAATRFGAESIVFSPETAADEKVEAMRCLGAHVIISGDNLSEAQQAAKVLAESSGGIYLEDGEDPLLMAGAATAAMEVFATDIHVDTVIAPVGGGNLVAGTLLAREVAQSRASIIGVQSAAAHGATASWLAGEIVTKPCATFAGGLATEFPGELALTVMDQYLHTMVLVNESELHDAVALTFREAGIALEGAAAAPVAALACFASELAGESVVLILSGSWVSSSVFASSLGVLDA